MKDMTKLLKTRRLSKVTVSMTVLIKTDFVVPTTLLMVRRAWILAKNARYCLYMRVCATRCNHIIALDCHMIRQLASFRQDLFELCIVLLH